MSRANDDGPFANVVRRAIEDVSCGRRPGEGPGWAALGIDADFLGRAGRHALSDDDRDALQRDAVRSRITTLMRGGGDPAVIGLAPPGMRRDLARRHLEDRLAVARVRRAFVDRGPAVRPMLLDAIRHGGVDAAAACMVAAAYRWKFEYPLGNGTLGVAPLDTDRNGEIPDGSVLGEIRVGLPLGGGVRLTTTTDMRTWLVLPPMPETVARQLPGRSLGEILAHRLLPAEAPIVEAMRMRDVNPGDQDQDHLLVLFENHEKPRTWRGCDPDSFGPIGRTVRKT